MLPRRSAGGEVGAALAGPVLEDRVGYPRRAEAACGGEALEARLGSAGRRGAAAHAGLARARGEAGVAVRGFPAAPRGALEGDAEGRAARRHPRPAEGLAGPGAVPVRDARSPGRDAFRVDIFL